MRLRRGHLTDRQWRRLLANACGVKTVDHFVVTVLHGYDDGRQWRKQYGCCGPDRDFYAAHGFADEEKWMEFALKRIENGQTLERDEDGKPVWRKTSDGTLDRDDN